MTALLASLVLTQFAAANHVALPAQSNTFEFVVLGDNRPAGSGLPPSPVFKEILREIGEIKPAFVLSCGDTLYGNEESLMQYRKECGEIAALIDRLPFPFFNVPGNHEIAGRPEFQAAYEKRFSTAYGSFDYGGCRFVGLCTDEARHTDALSSTQYSWLDRVLDGTKPTFVFLHRPIFARKGNHEVGATVAGAPMLGELFEKRNVRVVFEAHDHVFNRQFHGGVEYVISGGAGAPLDAPPDQGGFFHYMVVHVSNGKFQINVIPARAIQVTREGSSTVVADYSAYNLNLDDFTVLVRRRPHGVAAYVDKKGKHLPVSVSIVKADRRSGGFLVHLRFTLARHLKTVIGFK